MFYGNTRDNALFTGNSTSQLNNINSLSQNCAAALHWMKCAAWNGSHPGHVHLASAPDFYIFDSTLLLYTKESARMLLFLGSVLSVAPTSCHAAARNDVTSWQTCC